MKTKAQSWPASKAEYDQEINRIATSLRAIGGFKHITKILDDTYFFWVTNSKPQPEGEELILCSNVFFQTIKYFIEKIHDEDLTIDTPSCFEDTDAEHWEKISTGYLSLDVMDRSLTADYFGVFRAIEQYLTLLANYKIHDKVS